jgi:hypothetical protein
MAHHSNKGATMSEYDLRQYNLMLDIVNRKITSMDGLSNTLNNLQSLVSVLEQIDENWLSRFKSQWWILEEIYAYYDSQGLHNLDVDILDRINKSRQQLCQLIASKIQGLQHN